MKTGTRVRNELGQVGVVIDSWDYAVTVIYRGLPTVWHVSKCSVVR